MWPQDLLFSSALPHRSIRHRDYVRVNSIFDFCELAFVLRIKLDLFDYVILNEVVGSFKVFKEVSHLDG